MEMVEIKVIVQSDYTANFHHTLLGFFCRFLIAPSSGKARGSSSDIMSKMWAFEGGFSLKCWGTRASMWCGWRLQHTQVF